MEKWELENDGETISTENGYIVMTLDYSYQKEYMPLIAAAPEMLEALKMAYATNLLPSKIDVKIKEAIVKAEGK